MQDSRVVDVFLGYLALEAQERALQAIALRELEFQPMLLTSDANRVRLFSVTAPGVRLRPQMTRPKRLVNLQTGCRPANFD